MNEGTRITPSTADAIKIISWLKADSFRRVEVQFNSTIMMYK